jgi:phosphoglycerate dehydrogenase-like enzyme
VPRQPLPPSIVSLPDSTNVRQRPSERHDRFGVVVGEGVVEYAPEGQKRFPISNVFRHVVACDPYIPDDRFPVGVQRVSHEALFWAADVVSLHVPLNDETRGIAGRLALSTMKRGSWIVNTSRGAVVDVDGVLDALDSGQLDGAALDVLPQEPPPANHAILRHPRVLLTPHAAFYSAEGEKELRRKAAQNLVDWARTGRPTYVVVEGK